MGKMRHRIHFGTVPQSNLFALVAPGGGGETSGTYQCGQRMLKENVISEEDYRVIDAILRTKYSPIFVEKSYQIQLDNKA